MDLSPAERSLRASIAAHVSWAHTADPSARTAPARRAFALRFEREVDPEGVCTSWRLTSAPRSCSTVRGARCPEWRREVSGQLRP